MTVKRGGSSDGRFRYVAHLAVQPPGRGVPAGSVQFSAGDKSICAAPLRHDDAWCYSNRDPGSYVAAYRPSNGDFEVTRVTAGS